LEQIRIYHRAATDGKNEYWFRENLGNGSFAASVMLDVQQNCDGGPSKFYNMKISQLCV
jgi:hypothetical protein